MRTEILEGEKGEVELKLQIQEQKLYELDKKHIRL